MFNAKKYATFFLTLLGLSLACLSFAQEESEFFWDYSESFSDKNACFPRTLSDGDMSYVFYESVDKAKKEIKIKWRQKKKGLKWSDYMTLNDSFRYSGDEIPDMYSAAISPSGKLAVSLLDASQSSSSVKVYYSDSQASSFKKHEFPPQSKQITSSRIFARDDGGFILFISLGQGVQAINESSFSLLYCESNDGLTWSDLKIFAPSQNISNALVPFYTKIGNNEFVFFEGRYEKNMMTSLIYASSRPVHTSVWSEPFIVSDEASMADESSSYLDYKNFRPYVHSEKRLNQDGTFYYDTKIIWERTEKNGNTGTIMVAPLNEEGKITDRIDVESLNSYGNGRRPSLFVYKEHFFALWFDDRSGVNRVHLAENLGVQWVEVDSLSLRQNAKISSAFPGFLLLNDDKPMIFLVWQQEDKVSSSLYCLREDRFAAPPSFAARNFKLGRRNSQKNPSVKLLFPEDSSGIAGFTGIWTKDKNQQAAASIYSSEFHSVKDNVLTGRVGEKAYDESNPENQDEIIYFKARLLDNAGNWSESGEVEYYYDCTPPKEVADISFDRDEWGFASSNDLAFSWQKNENDDDEIAGYSWTLTKIAALDKNLAVSKKKKLSLSPDESHSLLEELTLENQEKLDKAKIPSEKVQSQKAQAFFKNRDNGIYVFSVRAIDSVGNAGAVKKTILFLNKYKAATLIKNVQADSDELGNVTINISGQEFSYDGEISQVIITNQASGQKYVFDKSKNEYEIQKDKGDNEKITGIKIDGMNAGSYTVQIRHSERGLSRWARNLVIKDNGTIKYEKNYDFEPVWKLLPLAASRFQLSTERILYWCLLAFVLLGILVCTRGLLLTARDAVKIRNEIHEIIKGDYMDKEKINIIDSKLKVRFSLKFKFGFAITGLLLFIVFAVSFVIGYQMTKTQERILISGLKDRVKVVLGNMSSGLQSYLDDGRDKILEIGAIVNQTDNFAEAINATILSYEIDGKALADGKRPMDYVWATNDKDIVRKIDSPVFDAGTVRYTVGDENFSKFCDDMNGKALEVVSDLTKFPGDSSNLIFNRLNELSASSYNSYPPMSDTELDKDMQNYYFFWPVMYQKGNNFSNYLQAVILLRVSTSNLVAQIEDSQILVQSITLFAGVIAAIFGLISAFMLSSIIVSPIQRIVYHVKKITDTEDKLQLEGVEISIKSHDELRTLSDSVNDMTRGLVQGARNEKRAKIAYERAAKEREIAARARAETAELNIMNMDGQAVQKAFIPLVSSGGEKETTASLDEKDIQVFGYYEGTDAVSGDYFDYKKLDDSWYAFIKCDASGHGVPAALIMTIVATIFRRYFSDWTYAKKGIKLNDLAADINDFIESLGLKGKFAAMMICLINVKNGDVYMCNAGDNILHVFDSVERKVKTLTLHEAPAAGPLPSFMVEMKGGYKVEKLKLKRGDVLFLYTDGIEESTRFFRNPEFTVVPCDAPNLKNGQVHETHKKGEVSEQMEPKRVLDIIEAVLNQKKYILQRYHSPVPNEVLEFDFTKCQGSIEDAIIALTAVEKIFRIYKKPGAKGSVSKTEMILEGKRKEIVQISGDGIKVDRKIDAFLKKCFNLYDYYCSERVDTDELNYVYYTGVNEDVQADDLTLLAIKKN